MQTCKIALLQLLAGIAIVLVLVFINYDFLHEFYIDNQETLAWPILNSFPASKRHLLHKIQKHRKSVEFPFQP